MVAWDGLTPSSQAAISHSDCEHGAMNTSTTPGSISQKAPLPTARLLAFVALALACLTFSASARAETGVIGTYDFPRLDPCGQFYCPQDSPGSFEHGNSVAVNGSGAGGAAPGDFYIGDPGTLESGPRVQQFSSAGEFKRMWGLDVVATGPGNSNETQAVRVSAAAGAYTLSFGANTTAPIAFNASAANVQVALNALGVISVNVAGGPGSEDGSSPYLITFTGTSGGTNQPLLKADDSALSGTGAEVSVYTTVVGDTGFEVCIPDEGDVCKRGTSGFLYDAVLGGALNGAQDLAIDQTSGDVYVLGAERVNQFSATGDFIRAWGHDVVASGPDDSDFDAQVEVTVKATGGSFTLTFPNVADVAQTTTNIPYNASAATVQAALNSLSSIGGRGGRVTVTGGPGDAGGSSPYVIAFGGLLGGDAPGELLASGAGLAGTVESETVARGGASEVCEAADACKFGLEAGTADGIGIRVAIAPSSAPNARDVLIASPSGQRVQEFSGAGAFIRMFGWDVDATDPTTGFEVCTAASGHVCKEGSSGTGLGQFASTNGSTLRSVGEDSSGVIYTAEDSGVGFSPLPGMRVQKFSPLGSGLTPSFFGTDEVQAVTVKAGAGQFRLGAFEREGTKATGTVTEGSATVTGISVSKGAFVVGQPINGSYAVGTFKADTTIIAVGAASLTLSQPAERVFGGGTQVADLDSTHLRTTADLSANASAAEVETALNALPTIAATGAGKRDRWAR